MYGKARSNSYQSCLSPKISLHACLAGQSTAQFNSIPRHSLPHDVLRIIIRGCSTIAALTAVAVAGLVVARRVSVIGSCRSSLPTSSQSSQRQPSHQPSNDMRPVDPISDFFRRSPPGDSAQQYDVLRHSLL